MRPIDVGIGHNNDAVITKALYIVVVFSNTCAQSRDENTYLFIGQHLIEPSLLHVEDLPFDGKDGLNRSVPTLFGRTTSRITFHNKDFAQLGILLLTIGQLSWEEVSSKGSL